MLFKKEETLIKVDGMHCSHCTSRVETALKALKGVKKVEANLDTKEVKIISSNKLDMVEINKIIEDLGFKVI